MPDDVSWAAGVVQSTMDAIEHAMNTPPPRGSYDPVFRPITLEAVTVAALSASPLPEAVALIERLITRRLTLADWNAWQIAEADDAAFVARVRAPAPGRGEGG